MTEPQRSETRTGHGIAKWVVPFRGQAPFNFTLEAVECHGRVALTRTENRRHRITDQLEPDEAEHLAQILI